MPKPPERRVVSPKDKAEAAFKAATTRPAEAAPRPAAAPGVRTMVTLRVDADVLEHFQEGGAGWQERLNAALRKAAFG